MRKKNKCVMALDVVSDPAIIARPPDKKMWVYILIIIWYMLDGHTVAGNLDGRGALRSNTILVHL